MTNEQKSTIMRLRSEGCKYAAIAEVVGLSINTVKSYCRRQNINATVAATPDENGVPLCKQCGKPLEHMNGKKPRKFCSDACRHEWWKSHPNEINKKAFYTKTCVHCGKSYTVYGRPHSKYCCHECSAQHRVKKAEASA
ncbi:RNA polymerase subunit sigma-70 [Desulfitobacterium sp.]|uniref:RNA polymerase subunit sigma-70 n=1 Tax=Desulfitobacterium sp. TaxID=49981 RepID=UPI002B1F96F5|nr:RNA polymerase subunit sigma-70 [Desulfitobacterium sp.]MEA4900605.1 RNA polymerase subunit sigma-70 [Desulfitobacterium sp.]HRS65807.1 RNA polymerase subunit sigma-70 [Spirochaetia bacterium]HRV27207.1 RNA polymerase subunit sigma-70 [Spirochaetia bacterium]